MRVYSKNIHNTVWENTHGQEADKLAAKWQSPDKGAEQLVSSLHTVKNISLVLLLWYYFLWHLPEKSGTVRWEGGCSREWKAVLAQYTHNECLLAFTEVIQHWPQTPQSCCTKTPSFTLGEWGRSLKVNIWDETSTRAKGRNYRRKVHVCRRDVGQDRCAHWHGSSF